MTELAVFQCDSCGDRHGHETEMWPWEIRYKQGDYAHPREETLHSCIQCSPPHHDDVLQDVNIFGVDQHEVEYIHIRGQWVERGRAMENPYISDAIEFLENELL